MAVKMSISLKKDQTAATNRRLSKTMGANYVYDHVYHKPVHDDNGQ